MVATAFTGPYLLSVGVKDFDMDIIGLQVESAVILVSLLGSYKASTGMLSKQF